MSTSAALVLFTGLAATAHADSFTLLNRTGKQLVVHARAVNIRSKGTQFKNKTLIQQIGDFKSEVDFGSEYRLVRADFTIGGMTREWNRKPRHKDPSKYWRVSVIDDGNGGFEVNHCRAKGR